MGSGPRPGAHLPRRLRRRAPPHGGTGAGRRLLPRAEHRWVALYYVHACRELPTPLLLFLFLTFAITSPRSNRSLGLGVLQLDAAALRRRQNDGKGLRPAHGHLPFALGSDGGGGVGAAFGVAASSSPRLAVGVRVPPRCVVGWGWPVGRGMDAFGSQAVVMIGQACSLLSFPHMFSPTSPPAVAREYLQQFAWRLLSSTSVFVAPLALRRLVAEVSEPRATSSMTLSYRGRGRAFGKMDTRSRGWCLACSPVTPLPSPLDSTTNTGGHVPVGAGGSGRGGAPHPHHDVALRPRALPRYVCLSVPSLLCSWPLGKRKAKTSRAPSSSSSSSSTSITHVHGPKARPSTPSGTRRRGRWVAGWGRRAGAPSPRS